MEHLELVARLAAARIGATFNQYAESELCRRRLAAHLAERESVDTILVGEAAGYRGARVSGLAFTSERQLTGTGPAEASATIVHRVLAELGLEGRRPALERRPDPSRHCELEPQADSGRGRGGAAVPRRARPGTAGARGRAPRGLRPGCPIRPPPGVRRGRPICRRIAGGFRYNPAPARHPRRFLMRTYSAKPGEITREWYLVDAQGKTLGRLATQIADTLRGKRKPQFTPHVDTGDFVVVVNAEKIAVTGNKLDQKTYYRHSGYPGGLKQRTLREQLDRRPTEVLRTAVKGMLPKNRLARQQITKLKIYAGPEHPHGPQNPKPLELN
jgi:large subunit ribosomal protein L13